MGHALDKKAAFYYPGRVLTSRSASQNIACSRVSPHISCEGCKPPQHAGRSGRPKIVQRKSASRFGQGTPAGLFKELIDGAMQHAAQPGRQFIRDSRLINRKRKNAHCGAFLPLSK
jgi:hypothetical protein